MNLKKHGLTIIKIIVIVLIYLFVLFTFAPFIDHVFTSLHKDETNMEIMGEIILQLVAVSIIWYYINNLLISIMNKYVNISELKNIESVIGIVSGLMFIGLQTHLKNKLNYITHEHPFRIFQFTEEKNIENTNENSRSWKDVFGQNNTS